MSYDVCILGDNGSPVHQVKFSVDEHHLLVEEARKNCFDMLMRIIDYYSDAEFTTDELHVLRNEIEIIYTSLKQVNTFSIKLVELIELCNIAEQNKCGIYTIAD